MQWKRRSVIAGALGGLFGLPGLSAAVQKSGSPHRRPKLKITDVRTAQVNVQGLLVHVRIYTNEGLIGQGEVADAADGAVSLVARFRRLLVGEDPLNIDYLFERMCRHGMSYGAQGGQYVAAMSAIEIALWDLAGKALGLPIYQLLGGKMRDRIRLYCDTGGGNRNNVLDAERFRRIQELGFTAVKTDIGSDKDPDQWDAVNRTATNAVIDGWVEQVAFVRESFDKRVQLAVDMHCRGDLGTGKRIARELERFKLLWLEEPVPPDNVDAMRDIRESSSTPICCGENLFLRQGFRDVLEKRAADIIMPDVQKCGGLLESRKIADMAHTYYVPMAPHCMSSPIGTMASCHVCAAIPNFLVLEWHWMRVRDQWRNFVKEGDIVQNGFITLMDRPGIGVEMDDEAVRKYQVPGTRWFEAA